MTARPDEIADRPDRTKSETFRVDALSDVLRAVRLTGAVFVDIGASAPWVAETPPGPSIVKNIFPDAGHLIPYHVVTQGTCWGSVDGEQPVHLSAGEIIVFPHGDAHTLSSTPGLRGRPDMSLYRRPSDGQLPFSMSMGLKRRCEFWVRRRSR